MPNITKIDRYNFEPYRFKVCTFFDTQCSQFTANVQYEKQDYIEPLYLGCITYWKLSNL